MWWGISNAFGHSPTGMSWIAHSKFGCSEDDGKGSSNGIELLILTPPPNAAAILAARKSIRATINFMIWKYFNFCKHALSLYTQSLKVHRLFFITNWKNTTLYQSGAIEVTIIYRCRSQHRRIDKDYRVTKSRLLILCSILLFVWTLHEKSKNYKYWFFEKKLTTMSLNW